MGKGRRVTGALIGLFLVTLGLGGYPGRAGASDTSLLFVGEDLSVLTIASRRAENPDQAPAVAQVITRQELEAYGIRTLGEALSMLPGFLVLPKERGSQPYARGVADSILFLYDSIPLTSDSTKSVHPLDEELSLTSLERIEVIRGPGSVLWGPDAFAAIVNIVPRRGRDLNGVELEAQGSTPNREEKATFSWGKNAGLWEAFVSIGANRIKPWENMYNVVRLAADSNTPVPSNQRLGSATVDPSKYLEAFVNFSWQDWLHLSARWSDAERNYVLGDSETDLHWAGQRKAPFRFVHLQMEKNLGRSSIRLNGYYNELDFKESQIDLSTSQKSRVSYGELLYDREFWEANGLLTLGTSYRYNNISGAVVSQEFLPDFLKPENTLFVPIIQQQNFNTSLKSVFGQVRNHWHNFEAWAGVRLDDHSQYQQTISHNMGVGWHPRSSWSMKLLYGTAYRTPYNQQLIGAEGLNPEQVQNVSLYLAWRPHPSFKCSTTFFWNKIRHHIEEDPYGGLSKPGTEDIYGTEVDVRWQPAPTLKLWANTTLLSQDGDKERYQVFDYAILKPDGTREDFFRTWEVPFNTGPKNLFNMGALWQPLNGLDLSVRLQYAGSNRFFYQEGTQEVAMTPLWLLDATATAHDLFRPGLDLQLALKNVLDRHYTLPGTYSPIHGNPFAAYLGITWRF